MDYIDQTEYKITLKRQPIRIVSLVPSQTELLYYLGTPPIAQTLFCEHPHSYFKAATKIGGTKKLNMDKIKQLKPDLIVGNKEENLRADIEELRKDYTVWLSDISTLADATEMIERIGELVGKSEKSKQLAAEIAFKFNTIEKEEPKKVLYLIWRNPFMAVGKDTFINSILETQGYENIVTHSRYPELSNDEIIALNPEQILLSSEPYPFKQEHIDELQRLIPQAQIRLVDGQLYSWYGPRLLQTADYITKSSL
jgi:ABC-type Fe3+-hydroxamate transport system substrate-binding protein